MGLFFGFVFFSLVMSDNLLSVQGAVYSSPETALKFSQCLIEKMSESQIFSDSDRNDMVEVANVMSEGLLNRQTRLSPRILLTAFVTSMADVITHEDVVKNASRAAFYYAALEQCSISTIGYIDNEFIELTLEILSSVENTKLSRFGSLQSSEVPSSKSVNVAFNPSAVQSSLVQNPHVPGNFDADGTNFKPIADSHPIVINPLSNVRLASNVEISSTSDFKSVPPQEEIDLGAVASLEPASKTFKVVPSFGGLNVPQTKESTVVVIPPNEQPMQNYPMPQQPVGTANPTSMENVPLPPKGTDDVMKSPSFPLADVQDQNAPSSSSLDDIIFNTLVESSRFRSIFNFNTPQEFAMSVASSITKKSLEGYNLEIINEAMTAVSNEVAKISFHTPENYALAFSSALIPILKVHNLSLLENENIIAKKLIANLESTEEFSPQIESFDYSFREHSYDTVYTDWNKKNVDFDFGYPPLAPEDTEGEIFSEILAQYLSESKELSEFFCNTDAPESKMKIYFGIIKSSLAENGPHISSLAASVASGVLSDLSKEDLCSNFAKVISEVIAEILDENKVLQNANAESIAKKMEFNLIQLNVGRTSQKAESSTVNTAHNETTGVIPTLQSSFPNNFDNINPTSSDLIQPFAGDVSSENKNYGTTNNFPIENYDTTLHSFSEDQPSTPIQVTTKSDHDVYTYTTPITTFFTTEITDEEFTSATTLAEISTSIMKATPTESSLDWAPSGVIDQEELASYLLEELETVLEAYYQEDDNSEISSNPADDDSSTDEVAKHAANFDDLKTATLRFDKNTQNSNKPTDENRRSETDLLTETKILLPDSVSEENGKKTGSKNFSVKKDLVELQPSFLDPTNYPTRSVIPSYSDYATATDDSMIVKAKAMSQIATSSIAYIHSGNFDITTLCSKLNEFAPIVNIPPLDYCQETAALDYLLTVLNSVIKTLVTV